MARCERYTGDTERFIENSRRCSVTKDETCNNRGASALSSRLVLSLPTVSLPTVGLLASARAPSPLLLFSPPTPARTLSRLPTGPGLAIATRCNPHRRRCRWCRCRPFLNFAVAAAGTSERTWTNASLLCAASNYMVIQIIGDDYRLWSDSGGKDLVSRFRWKCWTLPWPRLCLLPEDTSRFELVKIPRTNVLSAKRWWKRRIIFQNNKSKNIFFILYSKSYSEILF